MIHQILLISLCLTRATIADFKPLEGIQDFFDDAERKVLVNALDIINALSKYYEKYILRQDETYWGITKVPDKEYDFIIVGGGTAGVVIANRLSEISKWKILVLEAGQTEDQLIDIPLSAVGFQGTSYDWSYRIERQPDMCLGLLDERMAWPRGKALGGCSVLNLMMYVRGNHWDYNNWEKYGCEGWSYKKVLPYFLKSERARLTDADYRYHNKSGLLGVESTYRSILVEAVLTGAKELGMKQIDYNAPTHAFGVAPIQGTIKDGRRDSTSRAFVPSASYRENLNILVGAYVRKILIDEKSKQAYGVEYEYNGEKLTAIARKEVILSAGTINSAQLLILSGIGPKKQLQELKIPVLKDLPVGENLQDHLTFYGVVFDIDFDIDQTLPKLIASIPDYILFGGGVLTTLGGVEALGFVKTSEAKWKEDQPDIEYMFIRGSIASDYGNWIQAAFKMKDDVYDSAFKPMETTPTWTIAPVLLHPKSKGYLRLISTNPHDQPLIYPNYFTDPNNEDIKTFIAGIRFCQKFVNTTEFKKNGARINNLKLYGCKNHTFNSDAYWECALRSIANTLYHIIGTAKMGPIDDPTTVVNNRLQVHEIKRLRVADCSIIPIHTSGHTASPAVMIGERAADFLKEDWGGIGKKL